MGGVKSLAPAFLLPLVFLARLYFNKMVFHLSTLVTPICAQLEPLNCCACMRKRHLNYRLDMCYCGALLDLISSRPALRRFNWWAAIKSYDSCHLFVTQLCLDNGNFYCVYHRWKTLARSFFAWSPAGTPRRSCHLNWAKMASFEW